MADIQKFYTVHDKSLTMIARLLAKYDKHDKNIDIQEVFCDLEYLSGIKSKKCFRLNALRRIARDRVGSSSSGGIAVLSKRRLFKILKFMLIEASKFRAIPPIVVNRLDSYEYTDKVVLILLASFYLGIVENCSHIHYPFFFHYTNEDLGVEKELLMLSYFNMHRKMSSQDRTIRYNLLFTDINKMSEQIPAVPLHEVQFKEGTMFDAQDADIVDFANSHPGGGVFNKGMVQEEILFFEFPECLLLALLSGRNRLCRNEAYQIEGALRFSVTEGFGKTTRYKGECELGTISNIIVMDALNVKDDPERQYSRDGIDRELTKAFTAFKSSKRPIATGRWGCGAFGGDIRLKFMIQWVAASWQRRTLHWYHFGETGREEIEKIYRNYVNTSIGDVFYRMDHVREF